MFVSSLWFIRVIRSFCLSPSLFSAATVSVRRQCFSAFRLCKLCCGTLWLGWKFHGNIPLSRDVDQVKIWDSGKPWCRKIYPTKISSWTGFKMVFQSVHLIDWDDEMFLFNVGYRGMWIQIPENDENPDEKEIMLLVMCFCHWFFSGNSLPQRDIICWGGKEFCRRVRVLFGSVAF